MASEQGDQRPRPLLAARRKVNIGRVVGFLGVAKQDDLRGLSAEVERGEEKDGKECLHPEGWVTVCRAFRWPIKILAR